MISKRHIEYLRFFHFDSPMEFATSWGPRPDDGDHTHCFCGETIWPGDMCFVKYLEFISVVICHQCYIDHAEQLSEFVE